MHVMKYNYVQGLDYFSYHLTNGRLRECVSSYVIHQYHYNGCV